MWQVSTKRQFSETRMTRDQFGNEKLLGGCSSMVEPQPSKLMMWVRFPSPAPAWIRAHIAQSVEHFLGKEEVTGSNPVVGSSTVAVRSQESYSQLTTHC